MIIPYLSSRFFLFLQKTPFYKAIHEFCIDQSLRDHHDIWLEVGCGPGAWTGYAAQYGAKAIGIDLNPHSIAYAKKHYPHTYFACQSYETYDRKANTIFAASFLYVLDNPQEGLDYLLSILNPQGKLCIVETTSRKTFRHSWRHSHGWQWRDRVVYLLWGLVRGGKALNFSKLNLTYPSQSYSFLHDTVTLSIITPLGQK